jgi:hypothetical protein
MEHIKECIAHYQTYDRMVAYESGGPWETYEEFLEWNLMCLKTLSPEDTTWLSELCKRIRNNTIKLMDEESCSQFSASEFFFDSDKNIVIVNPR